MVESDLQIRWNLTEMFHLMSEKIMDRSIKEKIDNINVFIIVGSIISSLLYMVIYFIWNLTKYKFQGKKLKMKVVPRKILYRMM